VQSIFNEKTGTDERLLSASAEMDEFEGYRRGHANRIAELAGRLSAGFNLASRDRLFLEQAALIHDIGEVAMNRHYIRSSAGLTERERIDLERHPVIGEQEAARLGQPRGVQLLVRWHHEWWNGRGYPDRLEQEQIPLTARILRLADTYCAMTADRPFRKGLSDEDARKYVREWAGIEFDPMVVKHFVSIEMTRASEPVSIASQTDPLENGFLSA
jgi:HD-GYP domain-containing protein (c-di-GMP phosphodiesterase class II)